MIFSLTLSAAVGFIALSYEIVWYRLFSFVGWGHPACFGLLLFAYLLGIGMGSLFAKWFCKDTSPGLFGKRRPLLGAVMGLAGMSGYAVAPLLGLFARHDWMFGLCFVFLSAALFGAILPLLSHFSVAPDSHAGKFLSYLYVANIVGSTLGSFLTGMVLMDHVSTSTLTAMLGSLSLVLPAFMLIPARRAGLSALSLGLALSVWLFGPKLTHNLYEKLLYKGRAASSLERVVENRHGVIVRTHEGDVYGGGVYDGSFRISIGDDKNWIARAFAVFAMHPRPSKILMVGLATGTWARVLTAHPDVSELTVVEINPGYLTLIREEPLVAPLLSDPRVHIVTDDGRRWLTRNPDARFDLIVMNTTFHWRAHATNLLSEEYFRLTKDHLQPGGMIYFNSTFSDAALRTASLVFPHSLRFGNCLSASTSAISWNQERFTYALTKMNIGARPALSDSPDDLRTLETLLARTRPQAPSPLLETREALLLRTKSIQTITDDNMASEWRTPLSITRTPH